MALEQSKIPPEELEVFQKLKHIKVVFDVGARTDVDYLKLKPDIILHAFEPVPLFFEELTKAVEEVATGEVYLNNFGLGDKEGQFIFNEGYQAFTYGEAPITGGTVRYPVITLDKYVKDYGVKKIDFLKVDAEGYDFKVLLGGKSILRKCKYIQYEHWDNKQQYHDLLEKDFDMEYIGYRNVLCMNKKLVSEKIRQEMKDFIKERKFAQLV